MILATILTDKTTFVALVGQGRQCQVKSGGEGKMTNIQIGMIKAAPAEGCAQHFSQGLWAHALDKGDHSFPVRSRATPIYRTNSKAQEALRHLQNYGPWNSISVTVEYFILNAQNRSGRLRFCHLK